MNSHLVQQTRRKGFTIVESLIAIAILMIVIVGPLTSAQKGLTAAMLAKDQMIATYLVQDAHEYLHNLRDINVNKHSNGILDDDGVTPYPWDKYLDKCTDKDNQCRVDTTNSIAGNAIKKTQGTGISPLLYLSADGHYTHDAANGSDANRPTLFSRTFYTVESGSQMAVYVTVTWNTGKFENSTTVVAYLYDR
jgi:type II secretory pathway pseudopilin PulG